MTVRGLTRSAAAYGSVLAVTALVQAGFTLLGDSAPQMDWSKLAFGSIALASLLFFSGWLLWSTWRIETPAAPEPADSPARLLAAAVATLPEPRRDWGSAMSAELSHVPTGAGRWRFALGCVGVALFPPRSNRGPVVAAAALGAAAVAVAGITLAAVFPPMRVFAMTFVGLIAAVVVVTMARSRPLSRPTSGPLVLAAGLAAITSCIAATWYFLDRYPAATRHLHAGDAVLLAVLLVGALWLVVAPPAVMTGDRRGRHLAVAVTLAVALVPLASWRTDLAGDEDSFAYALLAPMAATAAVALLSARARRSTWAGVQATLWTALLMSLAVYAVSVWEAVHYFAGDTRPDDVLGGALRGATVYLIGFPVLWIPVGCWAAALGGTLHSEHA